MICTLEGVLLLLMSFCGVGISFEVHDESILLGSLGYEVGNTALGSDWVDHVGELNSERWIGLSFGYHDRFKGTVNYYEKGW